MKIYQVCDNASQRQELRKRNYLKRQRLRFSTID